METEKTAAPPPPKEGDPRHCSLCKKRWLKSQEKASEENDKES